MVVFFALLPNNRLYQICTLLPTNNLCHRGEVFIPSVNTFP